MRMTAKSGFTAIEIMFSICLFALASIAVYFLSLDILQKDSTIARDSQALLYAQEGLEAVRSMRDTNFLSLADGEHGLVKNGGIWLFGPAPETIDEIYQRKLSVSGVYRDESGDITDDGIIPDPTVKRVESQVLWLERGAIPRSVSLFAYLSDWRGDDWVTTTCTDFAPGVAEETVSQESGEMPDNCLLRLEGIENPGSMVSYLNFTGNAHANDIELDGSYAYVVKRGTPELIVVDISDPDNLTIASQLDLGCGPEGALFLTKYGDYLYIGSSDKQHGLSVVDAADPFHPVHVGSVDIGDAGFKPAASGNHLLIPVNAKDNQSLKVYDISNPASPSFAAVIPTGEQVRTVDIKDGYAYVGLNDGGGWGGPVNTFAVYDLSDPAHAVLVSELSVGDWVNVVKVSGPIAYLGTTSHNGNETFVAVNVNDPVHPTVVSMLNAGGSVQDLAVVDDHVYAAVDSINSGLASVNIENPFSPFLSYTGDSGGKATGIAANETHLFFSLDSGNRFMSSVERERESVIDAGTYVSSAYDTGSVDTVYNYLEWDSTRTSGASVKFQLRTADSPENLSRAAWAGPDGTAQTYYETPRTEIGLDPLRTGNRYCQYKVFFVSDGLSTSFLESIKVNYTP